MWGQILGAVAPSLIGGLFGGAGANAASQGAGQASQMQQDAANKAYEGGLYKPYGVTSGLGTSSFDNGQASFAMDPRYAAQQEQMMGLGSQAFTAAGGDYNQLADQFYNQQRDLGAGGRNAEALRLGESMFGSGRTGLGMSAESLGAAGGGNISPDGFGFAQAFAQQDAQDKYNAFDRAQIQRQNDINVGNSMFNQSMALDAAGNAQNMQGGLLGQYRSTAANQAGGNLISGMGGSAESRQNQGFAQSGGYTGIGNALGKSGGIMNDILYPEKKKQALNFSSGYTPTSLGRAPSSSMFNFGFGRG